MGAIIRTGLARLNAGDQAGLPKSTIEVKGRYVVALGAVSCFFQRQIEPLQSFEIYTRVLTWDRKWLYTVSHIIKKGAIKPDSYVLQPWKNKKSMAKAKKQEEDLTKHIFATSVARYVFKKARLTINPEIILERSRLLPPRPEGVGYPPRTETSTLNTPAVFTPATPQGNGAISTDAGELSDKLANVTKAPSGEAQVEDEDWTWEDMENERLRGLEMAKHFDGLETAHGSLRGGDVLGKFGDYF